MAAQSGLAFQDAMYAVPVNFLHDLIACHWLAQGVEVETPADTRARRESAAREFDKLNKRKATFDLIESWH